MNKNKFTIIGIVLTTVVLAGVAIFTAMRLYETRNQAVAPNVPSSRPAAAGQICGGGAGGCVKTESCIYVNGTTVEPYSGATGICTPQFEEGLMPLKSCILEFKISSCEPRPACLDSVPACKLPTPIEGWCPTPTCVPLPSCAYNMDPNNPLCKIGENPPEGGSWCPRRCTKDAKICPDGSSVGRTGPNCEFPSCPKPGPTATPTGTTNPTGAPNSCGGTCGSNSNCQSNFMCYQGFCRNALCVTETDCTCAVAQATAVAPAPTQPSLPVVGTSWPTLLGTGFGVLVIIGSLFLAL